MPNPMTGAGYSQGKEENEKEHLRKYVTPVRPKGNKGMMGKLKPLPKKRGDGNPKKKALSSMLSSLSSGANFRN